jgi:hypothetical protein
MSPVGIIFSVLSRCWKSAWSAKWVAGSSHWAEHRKQLRQSENQRAVLISHISAVVTATLTMAIGWPCGG